MLIAQIRIDVVVLIGIERLVKVSLQHDVATQLNKAAPLPAQRIQLRHGIGRADVEHGVAFQVGAQKKPEIQPVIANIFLPGLDHQPGLAVFLDQRIADLLKLTHAVNHIKIAAELFRIEFFARLEVDLLSLIHI